MCDRVHEKIIVKNVGTTRPNNNMVDIYITRCNFLIVLALKSTVNDIFVSKK